MTSRIKQGDTVEVLSGNYRGYRRVVQRVFSGTNRVLVSGVNIVKKHQRPMRAGRRDIQPGIIELEAPIHISNVMLVCPQCSQRTRVGVTRQEDGQRARVCKKCSEVIS